MTETGAFLSLRYDLRAPAFGAPAEALYRAALEQCAWAEDNGFLMATLSEHHGSDDGYCPSPLVMAAAIAGRTRHLRIMIAALVLPLYDPIRLAEDLAVLDLASGGRVDLILGAGYRHEELAMFGRTLDERIPLLEEGIEVLRHAWTGEEFEYRGRRVRVTPRPGPPRGAGPAARRVRRRPAARRAARLGLGFLPVDATVWPHYPEACRELGQERRARPRPRPAPVRPRGRRPRRGVGAHRAPRLPRHERLRRLAGQRQRARPLRDHRRRRLAAHQRRLRRADARRVRRPASARPAR